MIVVLMLLLCLAVVCCGAGTALVVAIGNGTVSAGEEGLIEVTLDAAPAGLSGYNLTVLVENESVAEFTRVEFPDRDWSFESSGFPSSSINLKAMAADNHTIEGIAGTVLLATLHVQGITPGESPLTVVVHCINGGNGTIMDVEAISGGISVNGSVNDLPVDDPPREEPPAADPGATVESLSVGMGNVTLGVGDEGFVNVTLNLAPAGVTWYNINISVENQSVAEWAGVEFPSWIMSSENCTFPASSINLKARGDLPAVEESVLLATVRVRGIAPGETPLMAVISRMDDGNGVVMDVEAILGEATVSGGVDNPSADFPGNICVENESEYFYTFNATEHLSLGSLKAGNNEGLVIFGIDTNDPNVTAVNITVRDTSELTRGFFVLDGQSLSLPLQVKGGNIVAYQDLDCGGVVLTYPILGNVSGGFTIDPLVLNQPVPDPRDIPIGNSRVTLAFDAVFI